MVFHFQGKLYSFAHKNWIFLKNMLESETGNRTKIKIFEKFEKNA